MTSHGLSRTLVSVWDDLSLSLSEMHDGSISDHIPDKKQHEGGNIYSG